MPTTISVTGEFVQSNARGGFSPPDDFSIIQWSASTFLYGKTVTIFDEQYSYGVRFYGGFAYAPGTNVLLGGVVTQIEVYSILNPNRADTVVTLDPPLNAVAALEALKEGAEAFLELLGPLDYAGKPDAVEGADIFEGWRFDDTLRGYTGNDTLNGERGDDVLSGGIANDHLSGGGGDDLLSGEEDNDQLFGGAGRDTLMGGSGDDRLEGGGGADVLMGGAGNDTYVIDRNDRLQETGADSGGFDTIEAGFSFNLNSNRLRGDFEAVTLTGTKNIDATGNGLANRLAGNDGDNLLRGLEASDTLLGGAGRDTLNGGAGADVLDGGAGFDFADYSNATSGVTVDLRRGIGLRGEARDDELTSIEGLIGSRHGDVLIGGNGSNVLRGGGGADELTGGRGLDVFQNLKVSDSGPKASQRDVILDFVRGEDTIDLKAIDADDRKNGDQAFDFIGAERFSGDRGELRYEKQSGGLLIQADIDGDRKADFSIFVEDLSRIAKADFIL